MINSNEIFTFPAVRTDVVFGNGAVRDLPDKVRALGGERVLLVSDPGLAKTGLVDRVKNVLEQDGVKVSVFAEVPQDSSTGVIERALEQYRANEAQVVVGLGGGSSLDAAKAVGLAVTNDPPLKKYAGLDNIENTPAPVIAVPTTAGTGSEVSFWSIMTNDEDQVKIAVGGALVFPAVAICDPELTLGLPPMITATTGMDALTHAVESYANKSYQPISEVLTRRAIELIGKYLVRAVRDGSDKEARYGVMLGSTLAGMGMNPTRLGIAHALAMPLGSWDLKIPHGTAIAVTLPHVMQYNIAAAPARYAEVARALGISDPDLNEEALAQASVDRVWEISEEIKIPRGLGELGMTEEHVEKVCEAAMKSGNIAVNPRKVSQAELEELCRRAL